MGPGTGGQHRQPFAAPMTQIPAIDRSLRSGTMSEYSDSGNEVEQMLLPAPPSRMTSGWGPGIVRSRPGEHGSRANWALLKYGLLSPAVFAPPAAAKRGSMGFRPAGVNR